MMSFAHYESTSRQNIDDLKDFIDIYVSEIENKIKKELEELMHDEREKYEESL